MKLEFSGQIFGKSPNIKFHQIPSSGNKVVPCLRTGMTKLIVAFPILAKAPNEKKMFPLFPAEDGSTGIEPVQSSASAARALFPPG